MPLEIERKFLVKNDSWRKSLTTQVCNRITQSYFMSSVLGCGRIRIDRELLDGQPTGVDIAFITMKTRSSGLYKHVRKEFQYQIPINEAQEILDSLCNHANNTNYIVKTRYKFPYAFDKSLHWDIDVFEKPHEFTLAEIEMNSMEYPLWRLEGWVGKEVTSDSAFYNETLAKL